MMYMASCRPPSYCVFDCLGCHVGSDVSPARLLHEIVVIMVIVAKRQSKSAVYSLLFALKAIFAAMGNAKANRARVALYGVQGVYARLLFGKASRYTVAQRA